MVVKIMNIFRNFNFSTFDYYCTAAQPRANRAGNFNGRHFYLGNCRPAAALFVERLDRNLQRLPHLRFNF